MNAAIYALLATEPDLPMTAVGWGLLLASLAVTAVWLAYVYR